MFRQQCQRSRSIYRYKEIEEGESSNSLTTWAKCKVLNSLVRNAETNFGRQSLSHHHVPVSTRRMRCESCQQRWKRELFAEDSLSLERTKSNTPKYMGSQNSDVSSMPRETESNLQTWNFDPIPSESRNWPDERIQGQAVHAKNWRIQVWCSAVTDASFHCQRVHQKRSTGRKTDMSILDRFKIIQQFMQCISGTTGKVRYVVSSSVHGERPYEKSSRQSRHYADHYLHE